MFNSNRVSVTVAVVLSHLCFLFFSLKLSTVRYSISRRAVGTLMLQSPSRRYFVFILKVV